MATLAERAGRVLRIAGFAALVLLGIAAFILAWWLALLAAAGFLAFRYVQRLISGKPAQARDGAVVIEGEYSAVVAEEDRPPAGSLPAGDGPAASRPAVRTGSGAPPAAS